MRCVTRQKHVWRRYLDGEVVLGAALLELPVGHVCRQLRQDAALLQRLVQVAEADDHPASQAADRLPTQP